MCMINESAGLIKSGSRNSVWVDNEKLKLPVDDEEKKCFQCKAGPSDAMLTGGGGTKKKYNETGIVMLESVHHNSVSLEQNTEKSLPRFPGVNYS